MIKLSDTLLYDESKPFEEQTQEVKDFLINILYSEALSIAPLTIRNQVAENGQLVNEFTSDEKERTIIFDVFARPREGQLKKDIYTLNWRRFYIENSTAWRLDKELITITLNA